MVKKNMSTTQQNCCKAVTKKGEPCKKRPMKQSNFCYIHNFGKFKGIIWYNNPTIHFIMALFFSVMTMVFGPSLGNQEQMLDNDNKAQNTLDTIIEKSDPKFVSCSQYQNESCPLTILALSFIHQQPIKSKHTGIDWKKHYSEVRLFLKNTSRDTLENINIKIEPETYIAEARQITQLPGVSLTPYKGPVKAITIGVTSVKWVMQSISIL